MRSAEPERLGPEKTHFSKSSIDDLFRSGIVERELKVGDSAPRFELVNHTGETISSEACLDSEPIVVSFYRGGWCEYCNLEMQAL
ncbi:TPA: hypothetical protein DCE37_14585 [Candidatus Latescibacteria bacterium]|nr:hypothetical protein [Candidatus Latescibacterota bacterium]